MKRSICYTTTCRLSEGIEKIILDNGIREFQVIYKKPNTNWNTLEGKLYKAQRKEKEKICLELIKKYVEVLGSKENEENKTLVILDLNTKPRINDDKKLILKQYTISVKIVNKYENFPNTLNFTSHNIIRIEEIEFLEVLCFNGFSEVSKVLHNNKTKTLKKFTVGKYLERELNFISKINSPNIVTVEFIVCYNTKLIGYIMETLEDSREIFKQNTSTNEKIIQIVNGLIDIHEKNISHCDIKLENIMIDKEDKVKIIDFGSAEWLESIAKPKTTEPFIPPEARDKELVIKESYDVYSFGMLLAQILSKNIYQGLDKKIIQDKKYGHIIQKCLNKDSNKRPSLKIIKSELENI